MKHYEELSRMRVDEAIQNGLRSQAIHRNLKESRHPAALASPEKAVRPNLKSSVRSNWFTLILYRVLGYGG
jgi:hypothetical protein